MKKLKTFLMLLSALILTTLPSVAQNRVRVQGSVKDANGEPLIGAMVLVKGTQNGAMTDASGNYSISGVANGATLTASLLGYEEQSIKFTGQSTVDFALNEDKMLLEEAVAIGYGTQSKITLTGSVTSTTGAELVKNSSVNLSQGLAGRMSGVIVNNRSGEPGRDDAIMYIRGRSTLGNNSPLIIIDGVPGRGDEFSRLTGEEIESINVLKDASAAIYGARSANGVILVTTKRGRTDGTPTVTFTYDYGMQSPTRLLKMADAVEFARAYNAARAITGASPIYTEEQIQHYIDGDDLIDRLAVFVGLNDLLYVAVFVENRNVLLADVDARRVDRHGVLNGNRIRRVRFAEAIDKIGRLDGSRRDALLYEVVREIEGYRVAGRVDVLIELAIVGSVVVAVFSVGRLEGRRPAEVDFHRFAERNPAVVRINDVVERRNDNRRNFAPFASVRFVRA